MAHCRRQSVKSSNSLGEIVNVYYPEPMTDDLKAFEDSSFNLV